MFIWATELHLGLLNIWQRKELSAFSPRGLTLKPQSRPNEPTVPPAQFPTLSIYCQYPYTVTVAKRNI